MTDYFVLVLLEKSIALVAKLEASLPNLQPAGETLADNAAEGGDTTQGQWSHFGLSSGSTHKKEKYKKWVG